TACERAAFSDLHVRQLAVIASVSEAIQSFLRGSGLLRRFAPRNDAGFPPAALSLAGLQILSPMKRGRRECRCGLRTRSLVCKLKKAYEHSHHRFAETHGIPCAIGFNGVLRALPGDRAFCLRCRCDA